MKRAIRLVTVGTLAAAVLVGVASVAGASPGVTTCNGELAAGTYKRVVVPADAVRAWAPVRAGPSLTAAERGAEAPW
jgi:hypothetical protein